MTVKMDVVDSTTTTMPIDAGDSTTITMPINVRYPWDNEALRQEVKRLKARNAELLAALEMFVASQWDVKSLEIVDAVARAAIAKAKGEQG